MEVIESRAGQILHAEDENVGHARAGECREHAAVGRRHRIGVGVPHGCERLVEEFLHRDGYQLSSTVDVCTEDSILAHIERFAPKGLMGNAITAWGLQPHDEVDALEMRHRRARHLRNRFHCRRGLHPGIGGRSHRGHHRWQRRSQPHVQTLQDDGMRHQRIGEAKSSRRVLGWECKTLGPTELPEQRSTPDRHGASQLQTLVFRVDQKVFTGRHRSPKSSSTLASASTIRSRIWTLPAAAAA